MTDAQAAALARLVANLQGTIEMLLAENGALRAQVAELQPATDAGQPAASR